MHPKTNALAATLVGSLLVSSVAAAQSADVNRDIRNNNNNIRNGTTQQPPQQQHPLHAQNDTGIHHAGPTCPVGCVPAMTREQRRAAARRSREEAMRRRTQHEDEINQARADQQREDQAQLDNERTRAEQCEHNLASARDQLAREEAERAERERLERERQAALQRDTEHPVAVAQSRGGGPGGFRSQVYFGVEGGVLGFTGNMRNQVYPGPAWGAHVGWAATRWFGIEGRYLGSFNDGYNPAVGDGPGLISTAGSGVVRFTAPMRYVSPYIFGGLGAVHYSVTGSNDQQAGALHNHTQAYLPSGVGLEFHVGSHWALTAEGSYNFLIGNENGTDTSTPHNIGFDRAFYTGTAGIKTIW